jgi:HD-GYP domain-containing protein (c-di-GMP phosphodiesterase class II)
LVSSTFTEPGLSGVAWHEESPLTLESVWDVLDRFGQAMQDCDNEPRQVRLTITAVQESLGADTVFWHSGSDETSGVCTGPVIQPLAWRQQFIARALAEPREPRDQVLLTWLDPAAKPISPWPYSAALVRISKTRDIWIAALSFHPRRLFQAADVKIMLLARRMVLNHHQNAMVYDRLKDAMFGLVRCLTGAIDAKDPYTWGHSERVGRIAVRLGRQMGLSAAALSDLYLAGLLHDIGKIGIRDSVLQKPGKLDPEEIAHIQEHPLIGDRLMSNIRTLQHLRPGIRNHHERFDGEGYPDHLGGEDIPLQARILAVADSCDAMMAARPYRPALPAAGIDAIMTKGAGTQWDPFVIENFLACRTELYSICQRGLGNSVFVAVERALRLGVSADDRSVTFPQHLPEAPPAAVKPPGPQAAS